MDVHLRELRYFAAVATELHFTRAAEGLHVSQPALSRQIRQLEALLGVTLFDRDRRQVTLTPAGSVLLPLARQVLDDWDKATRVIAQAQADQRATLTVGLHTGVGRGLIPALTSRFAQVRPGWSLELHQVRWDDATAGLADGRTDVAVLWLPIPEPTGFCWKVLAREARWVAMSVGHPLAHRKRVSFAELADQPFLALPASAGVLRDYWLALDHRDRPPLVAGEVSTPDETFEAVARGVGVVLLSSGNAGMYRRDDIVARPVTGLSPSELAVAWRADDHRRVVADLIDACDASLPSGGVKRRAASIASASDPAHQL